MIYDPIQTFQIPNFNNKHSNLGFGKVGYLHLPTKHLFKSVSQSKKSQSGPLTLFETIRTFNLHVKSEGGMREVEEEKGMGEARISQSVVAHP